MVLFDLNRALVLSVVTTQRSNLINRQIRTYHQPDWAMPVIAPISRDERRLMHKAIHKTHDKNYARRLTAMLMLHRGTVSVTLPERFAAPAPLLGTGLSGSRSRVLRD